MSLRSHVKLADVEVVEEQGLPDTPRPDSQTQNPTFELYVDRAGLTLHMLAFPPIERRWLWSSVEGFTTAPAVGEPEGRPRTALALKVDGRPLQLLVPAEQLPDHRVAALQKMAEGFARRGECPAGEQHPVRAHRPWRYPARSRTSAPGTRWATLVTLVLVAGVLAVMDSVGGISDRLSVPVSVAPSDLGAAFPGFMPHGHPVASPAPGVAPATGVGDGSGAASATPPPASAGPHRALGTWPPTPPSSAAAVAPAPPPAPPGPPALPPSPVPPLPPPVGPGLPLGLVAPTATIPGVPLLSARGAQLLGTGLAVPLPMVSGPVMAPLSAGA